MDFVHFSRLGDDNSLHTLDFLHHITDFLNLRGQPCFVHLQLKFSFVFLLSRVLKNGVVNFDPLDQLGLLIFNKFRLLLHPPLAFFNFVSLCLNFFVDLRNFWEDALSNS